MTERAFEKLRDILVASGHDADLGKYIIAHTLLAAGVTRFLEQWMAEQEQRDEWSNRAEADQYAIDCRLEQGAYR